MASDYLLKIDGIEGESSADKHKGEIDVMSFSWGVSQTGTFAAGGGAGAGKAQFSDFSFQTGTSKASPKLMLACATGQHIKFATLTARKAGEKQVEYMHIKFSDVLVSSYQQSGHSGDDNPVESLSLNYAKIEFDYTPQTATGAAGDKVTAGWDLKANKAV